jgi:hypothetical protein
VSASSTTPCCVSLTSTAQEPGAPRRCPQRDTPSQMPAIQHPCRSPPPRRALAGRRRRAALEAAARVECVRGKWERLCSDYHYQQPVRYLVLDTKYVGRGSMRWLQRDTVSNLGVSDATGIRQNNGRNRSSTRYGNGSLPLRQEGKKRRGALNIGIKYKVENER